MKKINLLKPIMAATAATSIIVPLTTLTSCGNSKGNLMEEYTPTIEAAPEKRYNTVDLVVTDYLAAVHDNNDIFVQDMRYTLSRGLPPYVSYVSEYCEISEHNFNADIEVIDVQNTDEKKTITFDITADILFDYGKTKKEEMIHYDMYTYRWETTTKARFVLNFDTRNFTEYSPAGQRRRMTTFAGATQLGISEIGSTVQLLSEKGYYTDLDNQRHEINQTEPENKIYHFMMPQYDWYEMKGKVDEYNSIIAEIYDLWYSHVSLQVLVLMFKYYMPSNMYDIELTPNAFDFGSYYMQHALLNNIYSLNKTSPEANEWYLDGFNYSLDSINNYKNLCELPDSGYDQNKLVLTLPSEAGDEPTLPITSITSGAFDGSKSKYTNLGIPRQVKQLIIPDTYRDFQPYAFSTNSFLETLTFNHDKTKTEKESYPLFYSNSFYIMSNVTKIDFSQFDDDAATTLIAGQAYPKYGFSNIHLGNITPESGIEGTIYLPENWYKDSTRRDNWIDFLTGYLGFKLFDSSRSIAGWVISPAEQK